MVSYVVTGASRGIGLAFVQALHARQQLNPQDVVFAIVQDPNACPELKQLAGPNLHILQGDLDKPGTLHAAATEVARITGGSLDVFINNAALTPSERTLEFTLTSYMGKDDVLEQDLNSFYKTNVIGAVSVTNAFLPLIEKGAQKKVINITTAGGDSEFVLSTGYSGAVPYGISKAAVNYINAKYAAEFRGKGYTFLAISPGLVDTQTGVHHKVNTAAREDMIQKLKAGYPHWNGVPLPPNESAKLVLDVIGKATPEDSGKFVSQYGDNRWL